MADKSAIEWTDATWNPIRARCMEIQSDGSGKERIGWHCEHISEGCRNCYAERINLRLGTGYEFKPGNRRGKPGYYGGGIDRPELFLDEKMLLAPLRWKKPRMIFVCSMTDLFADFVKDEWIEKIFEVMLQTGHRYQVLTKRPARMQQWVRQFRAPALLPTILEKIWLGISCELQEEFDARYPLLRDTPASVRFISFEPLLGHIEPQLRGIHWAIVGGESGPAARPMHPKWARRIRNVCVENGVAFFFKQWGEWAPHEPVPGDDLGGDVRAGRARIVHPTGQTDIEVSIATGGRSTIPGSRYMARIGKKAAGRLLDGRAWDEFPKVNLTRGEAA